MSGSVFSVLVVDDNRMDRLKMIRALNAGNYDVVEASGGQEAVEMLRSRVFHLVLLDILMPELNGFQVLEQMKSDNSDALLQKITPQEFGQTLAPSSSISDIDTADIRESSAALRYSPPNDRSIKLRTLSLDRPPQ